MKQLYIKEKKRRGNVTENDSFIFKEEAIANRVSCWSVVTVDIRKDG